MKNNPFSAVADTLTEKPKASFTLLLAREPQPVNLLARIRRLFVKRQRRVFTIMPCYVGNMYRISGQAALISNEDKSGTFVEEACSWILSSMPIVQYVSAAALQNNHLEPSAELIKIINRNFDSEDMANCIEPAVHNADLGSINDYYGVFKKKKSKAGDKPKSDAEKLLDEMPHRTLGSMLKYFEGGISEWQLKWSVTLDNYMLYISAIPSYDSKSDEPNLEVKDAADIF